MLVDKLWPWWIEDIWFDLLCHHFLERYAVCFVHFCLIYCGVINSGWFKVSNVFSLVEGEVFVGVTGNKYVDRCPAFNLVDAINYIYVRVSSL